MFHIIEKNLACGDFSEGFLGALVCKTHWLFTSNTSAFILKHKCIGLCTIIMHQVRHLLTHCPSALINIMPHKIMIQRLKAQQCVFIFYELSSSFSDTLYQYSYKHCALKCYDSQSNSASVLVQFLRIKFVIQWHTASVLLKTLRLGKLRFLV